MDLFDYGGTQIMVNAPYAGKNGHCSGILLPKSMEEQTGINTTGLHIQRVTLADGQDINLHLASEENSD